MEKRIFIINGMARAGKDTFVEMVRAHCNDHLDKDDTVSNVSSVDKVKEIAALCGYDESRKSEKDRKFLCDLKSLLTEYNDFPFTCLEDAVAEFENDPEKVFLFLHMREPDEIRRAKEAFHALTILVRRTGIDPVTTNEADANVENYTYDYELYNDGTLEDWYVKAGRFANLWMDD